MLVNSSFTTSWRPFGNIVHQAFKPPLCQPLKASTPIAAALSTAQSSSPHLPKEGHVHSQTDENTGQYTVFCQFSDLGWVDFDLGSSTVSLFLLRHDLPSYAGSEGCLTRYTTLLQSEVWSKSVSDASPPEEPSTELAQDLKSGLGVSQTPRRRKNLPQNWRKSEQLLAMKESESGPR